MPPRIRLASVPLRRPAATQGPISGIEYVCRQCRNASLAAAPAQIDTVTVASPISRHPPTQPPSHKPPEFRKSQLHRQYQSMLSSSPLMLVFQHNNLKAVEWTGIRRELAAALRKVDEEMAKAGNDAYMGSSMKLQIVQTGILASAMRIVEFWNPKFDAASDGSVPSVHGLSKKAYHAARKNKDLQHGLEPLLSGPLAVLTFPSVSPQHLKAALSILAPSKEFPAPKRKANPAYHEPQIQAGLQKLMLLAARVEGKVFDSEGTKWIGSISGGIDGLRAQLVAMLSGVGAGITTTLEAASKSLYLTMESRKSVLEEEQKGGESKE
ncbi:Hypothetical protein R9X50_00241400 [Acrodontium crateriforme]|uniref:Ribosomal protein YmL11, mitochondrial n=1 Tax=Acrodontium crateriforme TaxID=150365 RepID=A0AAQ3M6X1_9PEZI|nr:Hypothetical protein R9X50_00241400 [Acrodontium crateriforme]